MSASERAKGIAGEREVARIFRDHGVPADRIVQNSGIYIRGDVTGVRGYHVEVKRQEVLRVPTWLRQAEAECGESVPLIAFRQNRGQWYGVLPLRQIARLLAEAE